MLFRSVDLGADSFTVEATTAPSCDIGSNWRVFERQFTAASNVTVLMFRGTPTGDQGAFIDWASVREVQLGGADLNRDGISDDCQCLGDLDHDGKIDGADLGALLLQWGSNALGTSQADVNADGAVDGVDLGFLMTKWGGCVH